MSIESKEKSHQKELHCSSLSQKEVMEAIEEEEEDDSVDEEEARSHATTVGS